MGWKDGSKFKEWWDKYYPHIKYDENNDNHTAIKVSYDQGYYDGFASHGSYDPFWDND